MTDLANLVLRTVFDTHGHTRAIKDGRVKIPGVSFDFVEVPLLTREMSAVADRLEYDLGEITLVDYLLARRFGKPLVALPVFVNRNFSHQRFMYHTRSGIRTPKDLEGKRIGVKSYTQTAPVWARGILALEHGINLDSLTWVNIEGPHVSDYRNPPNVVPAPAGRSLAEMLESGEIDAADDPGRPWRDRGETWKYDPNLIKPVVPNVREAVADWYKRTGVNPILHVLVMKRDIVAARPAIVRQLFEAFTAAKRLYMQTMDPADLRIRHRDIIGPNFLPYGIGPNRAAIDMLCQFAYSQKITPKRYQVEDLFDPQFIALEE